MYFVAISLTGPRIIITGAQSVTRALRQPTDARIYMTGALSVTRASRQAGPTRFDWTQS